MRVTLANYLFAYKAPIPVIIQAFANQKDFVFETSRKKVYDCMRYIKFYGHPLTSRCSTIRKLGYCLDYCHKLGRTSKILTFKTEKYPSISSWAELYFLIGKTLNKRNKRYYIYKTTRSGSTTVVIIESLRQKKKLLMIAPLINIFKITVNDAIKIGREEKYLADKAYKIHRVKSNFEVCDKLKKQFEKVKDIENIFPFFYKGYCKNCKKETKEVCKYQEFVKDLENNDLIYLTVKKFNAMIKGGEDAQILLRRLLNWADVIFVDECSHIFDVDWDSIEIYVDDGITQSNELDSWELTLSKFCVEFPDWLPSTQIKVLGEFIEFLKKEVNKIKQLNQPIFFSFKNKFKNRLSMKENIAFYQQLLQYYKTTNDYMISHLIECFLNMTRKTIYLQLLTPLKEPKKIILASVNDIDVMVKFINNHTKNKLLLLTDATEPPVALDKCFDDLDFLYVNDPNDTAIKQKVYIIPNAQSFFTLHNDLHADVIELLDQYASNPIDPVFLVSQSIKVTSMIISIVRTEGMNIYKTWEIKKFDYFRGKFTKGQPSSLRRMIVFGTPKPPQHCYDFVADIYIKAGFLQHYDSPFEAGKYLENYSAQSSFFQAISRVKCPKGQENSLVVIYGPKPEEIANWLDMKINTPEVICL